MYNTSASIVIDPAIHFHFQCHLSGHVFKLVWTTNKQIICFFQLAAIWENDRDGCIIFLWNGTPTSIGGALKLILRFLVLIFYLASEWWLWCAGARSLCNQTPNIISPASQTGSRWCTAHYAIVLELRHALELEPWHAIECQHHISWRRPVHRQPYLSLSKSLHTSYNLLIIKLDLIIFLSTSWLSFYRHLFLFFIFLLLLAAQR